MRLPGYLRALPPIALLVLAWQPAARADEASTSIDQAVFAALAGDLLQSLDIDPRVAVRPFQSGEADLPADVTARFNEALVDALYRESGFRIRLVAREDLGKIWAEADEFQDTELHRLVAEAGADVLVIGRLTAVAGGVELSYKAYETRSGRRGDIVASAPVRFLAFDVAAASVRPLDPAIRHAVEQLLPRLKGLGVSNGQPVRVGTVGGGGDFQRYVAEQFLERLEVRLAEEGRKGWQSLPADSEGGGSEPLTRGDYRLRVSVWDHVETVMTVFTIEGEDGVVRVSTRIAPRSIPSNFLPLTPHGGLVEGEVFEAAGEAAIGGRLTEVAAVRGARALARARLVSVATGTRVPTIDVVRDVDDAARLLAALSRGIPYDEVVVERPGVAAGQLRVVVRAKVKVAGGTSAPVIEATITPPIVRAMEPMRISIASDRRAYLGLFVWLADDTVLRLYPFGPAGELMAAAGVAVELPRPGEAPFVSAPAPGSNADPEAVLVLASAVALDYTRLAPELGATVEQSMARAVPIEAFLSALAKEKLTTLTLEVLPYQVRR